MTDEQSEEQLMLASLVSRLPRGPKARAEYTKNCRMMIESNKAKVEETEEKIRLSLKLVPSFPPGSAEWLHARRELENLQMELDGWVAWVKRWEIGLAGVTEDAD